MGIESGTQVTLCDMPIRIDTYKGCSHNCKYCFVKAGYDISKIKPSNCVEALKRFIDGQRTQLTNWCDWNIPLHWGGVSDPFQPIEQKYKISLECLKVFAETQYPFVVSTKGRLLATDEYLEVLKRCNAVVQISMICDKYDRLDTGAPTYQERLEMCRRIAPNCKRLIVRIQPYMHEVLADVISNLPKLKEAGVYGITIEGMKFKKKKVGLIKVGGDICYPKELLKADYERIKQECHKIGLKFYCAENRLRTMGDDMCCCGVGGLKGFRTNTFNACHILNGDKVEPTARMKCKGTASVFRAGTQDTIKTKKYKDTDFASAMYDYITSKRKLAEQAFGIKDGA